MCSIKNNCVGNITANQTSINTYRLYIPFSSQKSQINNELEEYITAKIAQRLEAKKNKNYALADQIRAELLQKGITLKDTPTGTEYSLN